MKKEFYTIKTVAKMFELNEMTIRRMMDRGELPYYQIGKRKRIAKEDLEKYLERQRREQECTNK